MKQLGILRELFGMAERIIVATDAGVKGAIFRYIYLECRTLSCGYGSAAWTGLAIREGSKHFAPATNT